MKRIKYSTKEYAFREVICNWLETYDLAKLHYIEQYEHFERENDQSTMWHKKFYEMIRSDISFDDVYVKFLTDVIKPRYGEEIVYQKIPTFRVHLPGNIAVGEYHKDKYYRNVEWAEKVKETNYYVPLTKAYGTNTIWAETEEDKGDYSPMNTDLGEFVKWDGANLRHGNKVNDTNKTRVSFDFRVMPLSKYKDNERESVSVKTKMKIGEYFSK